ncbi:hypothetical protein KKH23_10635 [Patescibacteria group bacterium]|nr:hypothetical protein [Patescibacteria group bacterium]
MPEKEYTKPNIEKINDREYKLQFSEEREVKIGSFLGAEKGISVCFYFK